ncbi:(5-formylfuran-3-yl)methyl phosphate synthase [Sinorhizobium sp. BG8]|nr:(5-formylfuran-3-yl)methyl phosphate synthase [Sinorhizobium sp. BG8]
MTMMLASVRDCREADIVLRAGVDVIDLKEPSRERWGPSTRKRSSTW